MIYLTPRALLETTPPRAHYHALHGAVTAIVVVDLWSEHVARHEWEDRAGVVPCYPEEYGAPAPQLFITEFGTSHGVKAGDTTRQALAKIGRLWHHCCP